jgi:DNA-directed RNA polymerase subunit RPC12/RpoP
MRCPYCRSKERISRSRIRINEVVWLVFLRRPYRCRECDTRFFRFVRLRPADAGSGTTVVTN